jgi:hypothetical protein
MDSNITETDIQNLEHLGDWDHGMLLEPDVLDSSVEDFLWGHPEEGEDDAVECTKRWAKQVETAVIELWHRWSNEEQFQQQVRQHTEEEVAGMRLCVSKTVHQDSFIAPC